ncbi:MAG TPA: HDOD domain-containing protein [Steroidobacteraceae bacterium]|nr:HDOD domain-containing protein [Steroidobacteraceae bacterium]
MPAATVVPFRTRANPEVVAAAVSAPDAPRVVAAFSAALLRSPPRPNGLAACVGYLQEDAGRIPARQMGMRALQNLRGALFCAPGRDAEMALLWREALASACFARVVAMQSHFDAPLLTGAGLLHRAGEIVALRALAQAELEAGQRLVGPVMQEILNARDDELVSRVTRCWMLPCELRLLVIRWREEQDLARRPESVSLLIMAQAFATEMVHAATCTPGLVEAAGDSMKVPRQLIEQVRAAGPGIEALLAQLAPAQTQQA